jgi:hypothetical protein
MRGTLLFLLVLFPSVTVGTEGPSIRFYDLTYAAKIDLNDAEQVSMAWDHCHAVAALQGIVNREEPRLYIRFVQSPHFGQNIDDYWLEKLSSLANGWRGGRSRKAPDRNAC